MARLVDGGLAPALRCWNRNCGGNAFDQIHIWFFDMIRKAETQGELAGRCIKAACRLQLLFCCARQLLSVTHCVP
jgi:hypothetical protein